MNADMNELRKTARLAELQYLVMAVAGGFSMLYVPSLLIVPGDTAATVTNILSSERLFRFSLVAGLISQILLLLLVLTLYRLLRPVHPQRAALMVALVVTAVAIACVNLVNPLAALHLLSGADYLEVLGSEAWHAQAMVSPNSYNQGIVIAEVFWGLWLLPFGLLVLRSRFMPISGCSSDSRLSWLSDRLRVPVSCPGVRRDRHPVCDHTRCDRGTVHDGLASDQGSQGCSTNQRGCGLTWQIASASSPLPPNSSLQRTRFARR